MHRCAGYRCTAYRRIEVVLLLALPALLTAQTTDARDSVRAIKPPAVAFPTEAATANVKKFSFISYGDTRGRHDGTVMEAMLAEIRKLATAGDSIRFVLQSGDAVANGSIARQLTVSYVPIVEKLTSVGVQYFLSVGNHDVGNSVDLADTRRNDGLRNYFAANAKLLPTEGSARRLKGYPTYAFGYGNTFFIAFDSDIPDDQVQFDWVKSQLEGLDRKRYVNIALFYHHPAFSSGPHGGSNPARSRARRRGVRLRPRTGAVRRPVGRARVVSRP